MVMVKGQQNHRKSINATVSCGKKPSHPIAPKKLPLLTSIVKHLGNVKRFLVIHQLGRISLSI